MLVKGIISSVDISKNTAEVILPEYDNAVTSPIRFYQNGRASQQGIIGQFVVLAMFSEDFNNAVIL